MLFELVFIIYILYLYFYIFSLILDFILSFIFIYLFLPYKSWFLTYLKSYKYFKKINHIREKD
jgi:hypothetical protein